MRKNILIIGGILLIVALGYIALREVNKENPPAPVPGEETSDGLQTEPNAVIAYDQKPGERLTVALVLQGKPGFVVIHADDNGGPGAIIGASALLPAGEHKNVEVVLSRPAEEGEIFHAMLHADNANGSFDASTDKPVESILGGVITSRFEINPDALPPEEVER